jgi:acylphosphatase
MPESSLAAFRAVARGHVQGVNFREYVMTRARFLGLAGYVRNLPDGRSVEVVAEGPRPDLDQLLDHLREGPRMSRVDAVDVEWGEPSGDHEHFGVAY